MVASMHENLFNETFFKKNNYFRKELNISKAQLADIQVLIKNWQKNCKSFNPDVDKETTDENEFVDILFKKILGYSGKGKDADNYNILPKFKIDGASATGKAGYADLSLGYFSKSPFSKGGQGGISAEVVIEFKGQDSDNLTKLSNRPDKLSPVDQCWKYLVNHASAKWGIVTNFNEIRIYNKEKGQNVYETFYFNVPEEEKHKFLPLSTETEILKLITILKKENLLTTNGVSKTGELLKNKGVEETKVLKEFYLEYKSLRSQIFYEALKYNTQYEIEKPKSELLQLVQKFLDRIIFCWFCEDSREHLIPSNVLSADLIQTQTKDKYYNPQHFSIYGKVKDLFQAIDEGRAFGIESGYNGELFKTDIALDALKLPNFLFEKIAEIGMKYDFGDENELNVNILGHIFEQSISDLEEMRVSFQELDQSPRKFEKQHVMEFAKEVDVLEHKHTEFDAKKTKRKKEGVFYTPDYITRYIVENTVGIWLKEKEAEVTKKYSSLKKNKEYTILREYRDEHLSKIKILDPACGSGAFLIAVFNYLWKEHERVYTEIKEIKNKTAQGELFDFDSINKTILENNLYGVDLNRESVEITKLALWLKTAAKNKKLNSLHNNIKCGNSLVDDKSVVGDLAFDWKKEFPEIFTTKTKTNPGLLVAEAKTKRNGFDVVVGNPPYVRADIDNENYQMQRKWMETCGKYQTLFEKWDLYIAFLERSLQFLDTNGLLSFIISNSYNTVKYSEKSREYIFQNYELRQIDFFDNVQVFKGVGVESVILNIRNSKENCMSYPKRILHRGKFENVQVLPEKKSLNDLFRISTAMNFDKKFFDVELLGDICFISVGMVLNADEMKAKGEFKKEDLISETKDKIHSKEYVEADFVTRYFIKQTKYLEWNTERIPLKVRRPTFPELYAKPKILKGFTSDAVYDETGLVSNHGLMILLNFHYLTGVQNLSINNSIQKWNKKQRDELEKISKIFALKYILAIINSKFAKFYLNTIRRHRIEYYFYPDDLKKIPIKKIPPKDQTPFIRLADIMLSKNKELQEIQKKFTKLLQSELFSSNPVLQGGVTRKLEDWYKLSFDEFLAEIKSKKVELTLSKKAEWMDFFEKEKKAALEVNDVIVATDREIDLMVYRLYDLTYEEIKIIDPEFHLSKKDFEG